MAEPMSENPRKEKYNIMKMKVECLVRFMDNGETDQEEHYGILFKNGLVLCLCCKGYLEPEDYEITEKYNGFEYLEDTLKNHY